MSKSIIIGGGPAGLTAAYELLKRDPFHKVDVFESSKMLGGISRTEEYKGYRFDIGGHRFFTKVSEVEEMWHEVMSEDFITVPRLSRIYYRGRFFSYPLKIFNALTQIGLYESMRIVLSYLKWRVRPSKAEETFEQWVMNRFGGRLYMHFFRAYTEKVWGIPASQIRADWAAQRIKDLSLTKAVWNAMTGAGSSTSLIEKFKYPRLGPGMMWEKTAEQITARGARVQMESYVSRVIHDRGRVMGVEVKTRDPDGNEDVRIETADTFINSMALRELIACMDPPAPAAVQAAAAKLNYRDFLIVTLILNDGDPFPDDWIYIHAPEVKVGRIQNFRAWSEDMVPDPNTASIGMEYFCQEGDGLWNMDRDALVALATSELVELGLSRRDAIVDGTVIRQPKAYPVYDADYSDALAIVRDWLLTLENFETCGRNGLHRYNNQDHSMLSAMLSARNVLGEDHDIWNVNVERSYHEEFEVDKAKGAA